MKGFLAGLLSNLSVLLVVAGIVMNTGASHAQGLGQDPVYVLSIDGVINPLSADYLERGLREAREGNAEAVVVRLNTPGGLESSMREMTQAMLASPVPVAVFVTPAGGRAASAGMFITIAASVAAMEPGTNIGAAHPVAVGGEIDEVMSAKLENDAAALARSIATTRGRNVEWAEQAVRESVSITAEEAVAMNVVDLMATSVEDLLGQIDGRQVTTTSGEVTLQTASAPVRDLEMSLPERLLHTLVDPNIAYILFTIGAIGIIAELYNPGALFPGITGVISLILAFVAFGNLPVNWAGLALVALGIGLLVAEIFTEGVGLLAVGAFVAFVLGSLMLYDPFTPVSPATPDLQVSLWLVGTSVAVGVAFSLFAGRAALRARFKPATTGIEGLIGRVGTVVSDLSPEGEIRVEGELWAAMSEGGAIQAGTKVVVKSVDGLILKVGRA